MSNSTDTQKRIADALAELGRITEEITAVRLAWAGRSQRSRAQEAGAKIDENGGRHRADTAFGE
jgi:hypothetical protein